ncbi:MAG: hypothetical protein U1E76_03105 [Planctomycetota bacterium]
MRADRPERGTVAGTWQFQKTKPIAPVPSHSQFVRILQGTA